MVGRSLFIVCVPSGEGLAGGERRCGGPPGSLARLVDLWFDVLDGGQFGDAGLWLLVGHLGGRGGEVLIALCTTQQSCLGVSRRSAHLTLASFTWMYVSTAADMQQALHLRAALGSFAARVAISQQVVAKESIAEANRHVESTGVDATLRNSRRSKSAD